jgi:hypothetical protein
MELEVADISDERYDHHDNDSNKVSLVPSPNLFAAASPQNMVL